MKRSLLVFILFCFSTILAQNFELQINQNNEPRNVTVNSHDPALNSLTKKPFYKSKTDLQYKIEDVTKDYLERTKEAREKIKLNKPIIGLGFGFGSMGGFYTFSEIIAQLDTMRMLYPNLITAKDSIGSSIEGRTIWAVKISDNPNINEEEPELFYNSLTHAREPGA